ncbi:MAG: hypothetical protein WKG07_39275 [Hymenobacter sp.]
MKLFKGTNTQERIAANKAVLAYLQPRGWVVAATHDGELGALLQSCFVEYHFARRSRRKTGISTTASKPGR